MRINMRVTTPVVFLPETTYVTGLSVLTTDSDEHAHSAVISVKDPHSLDNACPRKEICLSSGRRFERVS